MKTVRRLLYRDIVSAVIFVALAFLSLFYFGDFVDEIDHMGRAGVGAGAAALVAATELPEHFYQLFPIAVLIGTIFALARLAQSSEFTILRTGGLGPGRALNLLASLAMLFAVVTFVVGDYAGPYFERQGDVMRGQFTGQPTAGGRGAWLKDHEIVDGHERSYSIRVGRASTSGSLQDVRIFEFDDQGVLLARLVAREAHVDAQGNWHLEDVERTDWLRQAGPDRPPGASLSDAAAAAQANAAAASAPNTARTPLVSESHLAQVDWASTLTAGVIRAAVLPPSSMSTIELYRYIQHLSAQEQSAQAHDIEFWRKALYPFTCFVMMGLALPFAYLHARAGGISLKVFGGIMLGISFVLLNNVAGHLGLLKGWTPWAVASAPSLAYLLLSLGAFAWLVRYR
ncbi:MAG: LPS export ABC transporter permease LptG [Paucibacter sp.]|nr:LPS export ABC transporter permease LptG [Roseateles sp.]